MCMMGAAVIAAACWYKNKLEEDRSVPDYVLTYAENQTEEYPTTQAARYFADMVWEQTEGKVEIRIHPNAELGSELSVIEQIQYGGIDFSRISLSSLSDTVPQLNVLQMPYIYTGAEHMWRVLDGEIGEEFMNSMDAVPIVPLSWFDAGSRCFYTVDRPVSCLEDLKGLKIRVQESKLLQDVIRCLGADPVPLPYDQVYSALETGRVDGAENNWPSYEAMKHNEVAPYFTVNGHMRIPEMQIISRHTWDKLPPEYQRTIRECARESALYERRLWREQEQKAKENVIEEGCLVTEIPEEEKERFRQAVMPLYEKYCSGSMDIVERIIKLGE